LQPAIAEMLAKSQDAEKTVVINVDSNATAGNIATVLRAAQALKVKAVMAVSQR